MLEDYRNAAAFLRQCHINEVSIWGFFTNRNWSLNIEETLTQERAEQVRLLISLLHEQGLKVLSGIGLYSWGFDDVIQAHPELSDGRNLHALCLSKPESWEWQRRVIDFVFSFLLDGMEIQSADQDRCRCEECSRLGDVEHHARINAQAARYIKERWPESVVGISNWGMNFEDPADLPHLVTMTRHADFLIDITDTARRRDPSYRRTLIEAIHPCTFGSLGGPFVEPPQHWERDRWFLPTVRRSSLHLLELYADGGRAVENFMRLTTNPSDEVSILVAAHLEANPSADWTQLLHAVLNALYAPKDPETLTRLVNLFLTAEDAYFTHAHDYRASDYIELEPLVSSVVGPPIYITQHLDEAGRASYRVSLQYLHLQAQELLEKVDNQGKMRLAIRCIERTLEDLT